MTTPCPAPLEALDAAHDKAKEALGDARTAANLLRELLRRARADVARLERERDEMETMARKFGRERDDALCKLGALEPRVAQAERERDEALAHFTRENRRANSYASLLATQGERMRQAHALVAAADPWQPIGTIRERILALLATEAPAEPLLPVTVEEAEAVMVDAGMNVAAFMTRAKQHVANVRERLAEAPAEKPRHHTDECNFVRGGCACDCGAVPPEAPAESKTLKIVAPPRKESPAECGCGQEGCDVCDPVSQSEAPAEAAQPLTLEDRPHMELTGARPARAVRAEAAQPQGEAKPEHRTCNRHRDCDEADDKADSEKRRRPDHCHIEDCEDCFGC